MFVCLERMKVLCFSLIGLTSDVCPGLLHEPCWDFEPQAWTPSQPPSNPYLHIQTVVILFLTATVPPFSSFYTSPKARSPCTPAPAGTHTCNTVAHAHMPQIRPLNSHSPCVHCSLMECLGEPCFFIRTLLLSLLSFSKSRGVISDGELIINSIKWIWLRWQIGPSYNIIINASSAVTTGHSNQMWMRLIGREGAGTLLWNLGKDWLYFSREERIQM